MDVRWEEVEVERGRERAWGDDGTRRRGGARRRAADASERVEKETRSAEGECTGGRVVVLVG